MPDDHGQAMRQPETSHQPETDDVTQAADTARITVHAHGELTTHFQRSSTVNVATRPGITIAGLLDRLGVPPHEVWICALNGDSVKMDAVQDVTLQDGDTLELFSPVAGG
ncbi:MAG: sulfur carrier protein ThiS [Chloroflexi bacterium]|nr:sulfur carrier protein ThiS [Chloroflexota bacterium]